MRRNKYNAIKVTCPIHGKFDSRGEHKRYLQLVLMERKGLITDLKRQINFPMEINGKKICKFIADFTYNQDGKEIVEDFKGCITPVFTLKKKILKAMYDIDILLTGSK